MEVVLPLAAAAAAIEAEGLTGGMTAIRLELADQIADQIADKVADQVADQVADRTEDFSTTGAGGRGRQDTIRTTATKTATEEDGGGTLRPTGTAEEGAASRAAVVLNRKK